MSDLNMKLTRSAFQKLKKNTKKNTWNIWIIQEMYMYKSPFSGV